jgi:Zn-dependent metalloprotease
MVAAVLPAAAFRAENGTASEAVVPAARAPWHAQTARVRSPLQVQAAEAADREGVEIAWHERWATPLSVRGADLGQRRSYSGGRGLQMFGAGAFSQDAVAVLDNLASLFGIQDATAEFRTRKMTADSLGFHHVRVDQMHNGLRVAGGGLIVHFDQTGLPYEVNGTYVPELQVEETPAIPQKKAISIARQDFSQRGGAEGALESPAELVVLARGGGEPRLAYEIVLTTGDTAEGITARWRCWIDATDGAVLLAYNDIKRVDPPGIDGEPAELTGSVLTGEGGGIKNVTGWRENLVPELYYMYNPDAMWILMNAATSGYPDANDYVHRATNDWGTSDRVEMSAAYNVDVVQRYFRDVHGRQSFDDDGTIAPAFVHYGNNYVNAFWNGFAMVIGDGDGVTANSLAVLDIFAHEYAHAITDYTADLIYAYESGALNESFSDIFGVCAEFYAQEDGRASYPSANPGQADWLIGEDSWKATTALRDMRNPANAATVGMSGRQPSLYKGSHWYNGAGDNGGVHQNSGVQNFFFYLLCEGGSGINDVSAYGYNVTGIGVTNAEQVAYRALATYCTADTGYYAAKEAWVSAARDLNPAWVKSVKDAWNAVLGLPPTRPFSIYSLSELPVGRVGTPYQFTLRAGDGLTPYVWHLISAEPFPEGLSLAEDGRIAGLPETDGTLQFTAVVTDQAGLSATNTFTLTILPPFETPFLETFEVPPGWMDGWTQEYVTNTLVWSFQNGNGGALQNPMSAYRGTNSACLRTDTSYNYVTRLVSPRLVFDAGAPLPQLSFWHYMARRDSFQDQLRVYSRSAHTNDWTLLATYTNSINVWTRQTLALPDPSETYYICFEGTARYGYGIHIDDVTVRDAYETLAFTSPGILPEADAREPYAYAFQIVGGFGPYAFELTEGALPDGLSLSTNGVISGVASNAETCVFTVELTDHGDGATLSQTFSLTVGPPRATLFFEGFENGGSVPSRWVQQTVTNSLLWKCIDGGGNGDIWHKPSSAYEGLYNAVLWVGDASDHTTRLVTRNGINLGAAPVAPRLEFWHAQPAQDGRCDELRVYCKAGADAPWILLAAYTESVESWTKEVLFLPQPSTNYFLAFEGTAHWAHGVSLDNIRVSDGLFAPVVTAHTPLPGGLVGWPYSEALSAVGGMEPYTWQVVSGSLPPGLSLSTDGVVSGTPLAAGTSIFSVRVAGTDGHAATNAFSLTVTRYRLPFEEGAEGQLSLPPAWSQEVVSPWDGRATWMVGKGNPSAGTPTSAHNGTNNFYLYSGPGVTVLQISRLTMPGLDMGAGMTNATLSFWLCAPKGSAHQGELTVLYATNALAPAWQTLATIRADIPAWSNVVLVLPDPSPSYVIAFDGKVMKGSGISIDDVLVTGDYPETGYDLWASGAFGGETDEAVVGRDADPDGDGVPNVWEYIFGSDPQDDTDGARAVIGIAIVDGEPVVTFPFGKEAEANGVTWWLETCTDLLVPAWVPVDGEESRTEQATWWDISYDTDLPINVAPRRFFRLRATVP